MISKDTIDRVFSEARIEEVIGDFVALRRSGSELQGLVPVRRRKNAFVHGISGQGHLERLLVR